MRPTRNLALLLSAAALSACASVGGDGFGSGRYTLVRVQEVRVGNDSMAVTPPREWNKISSSLFVDIHAVEDWTQNGPYLDGISFVTGLKDGKALVYQRSRDDRQVPKFRSNMTPLEITSMIESLFRVRAGAVDFKTVGLSPRTFMGYSGFQYDYEHLDGDEVRRKGRAVGAVIDGRLYLILFDAARSHYYGALLPDFEAVVNSARLI
ncbi:hypothetical protein LZ496_01230 [Sphingomonas sp. NSE70-1]|uniref:Lipoprotein n=1 Tax=Sphingomonas caseinilyticus TaxID=2908205 RepID=A0ABT0RQW7_9SPHN|nr:hypothetical protein [Sphingomonas caseinilyticus]MCL6697413.1 hypothetical protein [Sphingomonas caseinilyticus]